MKAHIKIPHGWRRLRSCEKVKERDMYLSICGMEWRLFPSEIYIGRSYSNFVVIRKARKGGKAK